MLRRLKLFAWILSVPIVTIIVALYIQSGMERDWRALLVKHFGSEKATRAMSFAEFCSRPDRPASAGTVCGNLHMQSWLLAGGIIAGLLGLGLLAAIALAGRRAASQRQILLTVFGNGLRVTVVAIITLITLHALLAMAAIWYGESYAVGTVHYMIIGFIGLGAVMGLYAMAKAIWSVGDVLATEVRGMPLNREDEPELWQFVDNLARQVGTEPPTHIVAGLFPTFYVTEANVRCDGHYLTGRTLYVSLALCRILTRLELAAIIGHELGHFLGEDTAFSRRFYPIYRRTHDGIAALGQQAGGWRSIALLPAMHLLAFFLESFARAESGLSRERELVADNVGASVSSVQTAGVALVKVHAFTDHFQRVLRDMRAELAAKRRTENASLHYLHLVQEDARPEALQGLDQQRIPHPFDSHPPLSVRLEALGLTLEECSGAALQVTAAEMAIGLIHGAASVEQALTERDNRWLVLEG